ncbi:MAG: cyclic-di-AMP receptor [Clostridiales bacterium]|nr:cyclic-di-AMP receptor [Clostridiales bacterium]
MRMVVAVVHLDDAPNIVERLAQKGYGSTCIHSQGSFLQQENRTLLVGVADDRVKEVLSTIRSAIRWRRGSVTGKSPANSMMVSEDAEITIAGATVFVLNVDQFLWI